ncbi:MAG: cob(I)yrinic acid a,c-diamide adenosyltransferase [archaeon]|jgi:cob(I)alamin adenosyltransferase|nr:cob(I)yrinic acid a,c-diamide adenosyltransferase [archaeon]
MGKIYLLMGEGAGKTTSALGLAMRSLGHNRRVVVIQFMKFWKNTGEYLIQKKLKPNYEVYQFGRPVWLKISKKKPVYGKKKFVAHEIERLDREYALEGMFKADCILKEKPHLLILDELGLAVNLGLVSEKEALCLLKNVPKETSVVITGRKMPKSLIKRADFANEIKSVKYSRDAEAEEGIQF